MESRGSLDDRRSAAEVGRHTSTSIDTGFTPSNESSIPQILTTAPSRSDSAPLRPRPGHFRSNSYLSPIHDKDNDAHIMPLLGSSNKEKDESSGLLSKVHLPGHKSRHSNSQNQHDGSTSDRSFTPHIPSRLRSHRHTRSEAVKQNTYPPLTSFSNTSHPLPANGASDPPPTSAPNRASGNMLTRMATNISSLGTATDNVMTGFAHLNSHRYPGHKYSASDLSHAHHLALPTKRPIDALHRRATSDGQRPPLHPYPHATNPTLQSAYSRPSQNVQPQSSTEALLLAADRRRAQSLLNATPTDAARLATQLAEANIEIQSRFTSTEASTLSLMQRLDDLHDDLTTSLQSLHDTIDSFINLSSTWSALSSKFKKDANVLDANTRAQLDKSRESIFTTQDKRVNALEERGQKAGSRAEELSVRLENCRTVLRNYAARETKRRKAWKGVIVGCIWGVALVVLAILVGVTAWWIRVSMKQGDGLIAVMSDVVAALGTKGDGEISRRVKTGIEDVRGRNDSVGDNANILRNLPEDVRKVLEEIRERHERGGVERVMEVNEDWKAVPPGSRMHEDGGLDRVFAKLEL